jgi:NAD(P)-dependent dehydrogenase (short-subunit alcohol dehydrogenase family)
VIAPISGSTALVTGAAGGMGAATVRALVASGVAVLGVDAQEPDQQLRELPATRWITGDLTDATVIAEAIQHAQPSLDYLVNAAGVAWFERDGSVLTIDEAVWQRVMSINLDVMRSMSAAALPLLRRGQGKSMVHVASIAGLRAMDSPLDAYQVSKAAVISLSRALALQLGPEGIRSNTVCPGATLTPMIEHLYIEDPARRTRMEERTPLRRLGLPEDIASAIMYLLSPQASFVTGIDLVVDGGWIAQIR